jgi:hypothetical protein
MVVAGRSTTLLFSGVNGSQMAVYTQVRPSSISSYASQGAFASTSQSTSCSPFSQTHNFTGVTMSIDGTNTTGIAFTATVTEQSCAYQGRIAEYGNGNYVIPDVLAATVTLSGCGLGGYEVVLTRDFLNGFTWTGVIGTRFVPNSSGDFFLVRLQMVNVNGAGSDRSKFILFVMNYGGGGCRQCWVWNGTFTMSAVPCGGGSDTPLSLTFSSIVLGTRLNDGVSISECICLAGLGSSMNIEVNAASENICCPGLPDTLYATLGSDSSTSLPITKRAALGDWFTAVTWTGPFSQTHRSAVSFFCQNSQFATNFNAKVASLVGTNTIREASYYYSLGFQVPVTCSPFLVGMGQADFASSLCNAYAYNAVSVSE